MDTSKIQASVFLDHWEAFVIQLIKSPFILTTYIELLEKQEDQGIQIVPSSAA